MSRRKAISTAGKVAIGAAAAAIIAGGGTAAYFAGRPTPASTSTSILTSTVTSTTTSVPTAKQKIGYITRLAVPWWIIAKAGFQAAADKNGFDAVFYDPPQLTVEDQVRVLQSWVAAGMSGVLIGPNDPAAPVQAINAAIDKGVPVLTGYGVDSPTSERLLFVGYDPAKLGAALGASIVILLQQAGIKPPGKISYHTGGMSSTEDVASYNGFKSAVEPAGYTVTQPVLDGGDAAKAVSLAAQTVQQYSDLVGMMGYYDYTGPALGKAVTDAGKAGKIVVQADGLIAPMVPYFSNGVIGATIELRQFEGSSLAGEILHKLGQVRKDKWNDVLTQYVKDYPSTKQLILPFGLVTGTKLNVQPPPGFAWVKTLNEYKTDFADVWKIINSPG